MNHLIIGTAGHVDHGKTLLIKALTGMDTDRLAEEKKRGITIELGFAHLTLPNGEQAGIVDVPGHEKFVKNMLAGAGGMDLVLLVVAADEGFMPQTREHLGILSLLNIPQGIVVLTKGDLVDEEWLLMMQGEVEKEVKGTFLEGAPVIPVSSVTRMGMDRLLEEIVNQVAKAKQKNIRVPFRVPVDRVFSVDGFGTVITGTLLEGTVHEGDEVVVYPAEIPAKVRSLQVHGKNEPVAYAGQRTAINLAGLRRTQLEKGDVIAPPGSMAVSMMLDVRLDILPDCDRVIKNGSRLHFYHGTRDVLCKLVLLEQDGLEAGAHGYAQLRLSEPVATKPGDYFVLRFYSPVETVGGGVILNSAPGRHKRGDLAVIEGLQIKQAGSGEDKAAQLLREKSLLLPTVTQMGEQWELSKEETTALTEDLCARGIAVQIADRLIHSEYWDSLLEKLLALLAEYHKKNPLLTGPRKEELRGKLLPNNRDLALLEDILAGFVAEGRLGMENGHLFVPGWAPSPTPLQKRLWQEIEATYQAAQYSPPATEDILSTHPKEKDACRQVLEALQAQGTLVAIAPGMLLHGAHYQAALALLVQTITQEGEITLAAFRDLLGSSRKYVLALLEYWDRRGFTVKKGEARVLSSKWEGLPEE